MNKTNSFTPAIILAKKTSAQPEYDTAPSVHEVYHIETMNDWFLFELISLVRDNIPYKKCRTYGNFFIPAGRSDKEYCSRFNPKYGNLCREIWATLTFENCHKDDRIRQAYTQAYTTWFPGNAPNKSHGQSLPGGRIAREKRTLWKMTGLVLRNFRHGLMKRSGNINFKNERQLPTASCRELNPYFYINRFTVTKSPTHNSS